MKKVLQIAKFFFLLLMVSTSFLAHSVDEVDLAAWNDAKVDWKKFQGTQLTVLADAQPAFVALKPYLPVFESLTGIKVGYITVEQSEMRKRREVDLISKGGVYDVVPIGVTFLGQAYKNNWLTPLEPYLNNTQLTDPDWYKFDDLSTNSLRLCTIEKTLLSVPFDFSAPVLFYRKDLFTKFNIQVPSTYQEMVTAKKQLQQAMDNAGMQGVYAFASRTRAGAGLNTWTVIPAIRSYGGSILDSNNRPVFNSPEAVQALETYRDMVTGYGNPPNSQLLHFYEIRQQFREGKLAAAFLASHFFNEIDSPEKSPIWDKWDATKLPRGPVSRETSPWAWAFAINNASKNKEAAWMFLQWATSEPTAKLLNTGGSPARKAVWQSEYFTKLNAPGLLTAVNWIFEEGTNARIQSGMPEFPIAGEIFSRAFNQIFYGADVKSTLDQAVRDVEKVVLLKNEGT